MSSESWLQPDWPAPLHVGCLLTTRLGGVSQGDYASLNLGDHVGDDPAAVARNRLLVTERVPQPIWLEQVHGTQVIDAAQSRSAILPPQADAAFVREPGIACAVMTADCLPVLFCDRSGSVVAAAHAGWRGLLAGVLEQTIAAMAVPGRDLMDYIGPAIGPHAFEVGEEVRSAYLAADTESARAFAPSVPGKWLADIYLLGRQRLAAQGLTQVYGGNDCTFSDPRRFFSYRRDGRTGRMASMIWLKAR